MNKILISVIVPVYNVEIYLRDCVESILNQTFKAYEIILVNDGSTDSSSVICNDFANADERIKVIHKENSGVSATRNIGIKNAKGDYLMFLDSDDTLVNDCLLKVSEAIFQNIDYDIFFCNHIINRDGIRKRNIGFIEKHLSESISGQEIIDRIIDTNVINPCWNKVYKKYFILNNNIFFNNYIFGEDFAWGLELLLRNPKSIYKDIDLIEYKEFRAGSVTSKVSIIKSLNIMDFAVTWYKRLQPQNSIINYLAKLYLSSINDYYKYNKKDKVLLKEKFNVNHELLKQCNEGKTKILIICIKLSGIYYSSLIKNIIKKVNK